MSLSDYHNIIANSHATFRPVGIDGGFDLPPDLFPHQKASVEFALRVGCAALFLDTGLGKTLSALAWGREVSRHTGKPVLMLAPLGVVAQHKAEADRYGIQAVACRDGQFSGSGIIITNYERLHLFDVKRFGGVILDESSILKSFTGQTTKKLIEEFSKTPYRLCCTATPAPNDHTELGTHSEFLGVMKRDQRLMRWFIHDSMDTLRRRWPAWSQWLDAMGSNTGQHLGSMLPPSADGLPVAGPVNFRAAPAGCCGCSGKTSGATQAT